MAHLSSTTTGRGTGAWSTSARAHLLGSQETMSDIWMFGADIPDPFLTMPANTTAEMLQGQSRSSLNDELLLQEANSFLSDSMGYIIEGPEAYIPHHLPESLFATYPAWHSPSQPHFHTAFDSGEDGIQLVSHDGDADNLASNNNETVDVRSPLYAPTAIHSPEGTIVRAGQETSLSDGSGADEFVRSLMSALQEIEHEATFRALQ